MHRFVRAAFLRSLQRRGLGHLAPRPDEPPRRLGAHEGGMPSPLEIYLAAVERARLDLDALRGAILGFAPHLVINSARSKSDMELGRAVASVARRRLGRADPVPRPPRVRRGGVGVDAAPPPAPDRAPRDARSPSASSGWRARSSRRGRRPATAASCRATSPLRAARGARRPRASRTSAARTAGSATSTAPSRSRSAGCTTRRASRRCTAGSTSPYTTLMDAAKRKDYDLELFPDGVPMPVTPPPGPPGSGPTVPARGRRTTR